MCVYQLCVCALLGQVFQLVMGMLMLVHLFGCFFFLIASLTQNHAVDRNQPGYNECDTRSAMHMRASIM